MFYQYSYQKATPKNPHPGHVIPDHLKLIPTIFSAIGMGILGSAIYPILSFQLASVIIPTKYQESFGLLSPLVDDSEVSAQEENPGPQVIGNIDYSKASNWFVATSLPKRVSTPTPLPKTGNHPPQPTPPPPPAVEYYSLSIPSLAIERASVKVDGEDLAQSLVHYPGTALPGEYGTPVIFGHSTLPQLFKPDNYLTIFATLPTIKVGADIFVTVDKVTYTYRVTKLYQVKPTDTWALGQAPDQKTMKLITCVPPGTRFRRLVVEAILIPTT